MQILSADDLGQPPIHDVSLAELPDHDVLRFDVSVDHAPRMRVRESPADLDQAVQRGGASPASFVASSELEDFLQAPAADERHREEQAPFRIESELVHGEDTGVVELSSDLRLL